MISRFFLALSERHLVTEGFGLVPIQNAKDSGGEEKKCRNSD
jgi:hypothetical protein